MKDNNKLKDLNISNNSSHGNSISYQQSLVRLRMWNNPISGHAMVAMLQALKNNTTLQELYVFSYPPAIKDKISSIAQEINTREEANN